MGEELHIFIPPCPIPRIDFKLSPYFNMCLSLMSCLWMMNFIRGFTYESSESDTEIKHINLDGKCKPIPSPITRQNIAAE